MSDDRPVFLKLLGWIQTAISILAAIVSVPFSFYMAATSRLVCAEGVFNTGQRSDRPVLYTMLWFPRWIAASFAIPLFLGQIVGVSYVGYRFAGSGKGEAGDYVLAVLFGLIMTYFLLWGRRYFNTHVVKDRKDHCFYFDWGKYLTGLGQAQIDLICCFFFLLGLVMVVRLPYLAFIMRSSPKDKSRWGEMIKMPFWALFDLVAMPCGLIAIFSFRNPLVWNYRGTKLHKLPGNKWAHSSGLRWHFIGQFIAIFITLFVLSFIVLLAICPWRLFVLYPRSQWKLIKQSHNYQWLNKPDAIFKQLAKCIMDIVIFFMWITVLLPTMYRVPRTIRRVRTDLRKVDPAPSICSAKGYSSFAAQTVEEYFKVWRDVPFVFMGLFATFTLLRTGFVIRGVVKHFRQPAAQRHSKQMRHLVAEQCIKFFRDLPFIFMGIFTCITLIRAYPVLKGAYDLYFDNADKKHTTEHLREKVAYNFAMVFRDMLFELPFYFAGFIVMLSVVRARGFAQDWFQLEFLEKRGAKVTRCDRRKLVIVTFFRVCLDVFCIPCVLFLMMLPWRIPRVLARVRREQHRVTDLHVALDKDLTDLSLPFDGPLGLKQAAFERRAEPIGKVQWIIFEEAASLVWDVPFFIFFVLTCLTLYRAVKICRNIYKLETDEERRNLVSQQFVLFLADFPAFFLLLILTFSWRSISVWSDLCDKDQQDDKHFIIFSSFALLFVDIPFILLAPLTLWRFPQVVYYMILIQIEQGRQEKEWKTLRASAATPEQRAALVKSEIVTLGAPTRWAAVANTLLKTIQDVPITLFVVLMTCTVWRMFALVPRLHRRKLALQERKRQKQQAKEQQQSKQQNQQPPQAQQHRSDVEVQLQTIPPQMEDVELQLMKRKEAALEEEEKQQQISMVVELSKQQQQQHLVTYDTKSSFHLVVLKEFLSWCLDLPFVLCALWLLVLGWWRIPALRKRLKKPCFEYHEPPGPVCTRGHLMKTMTANNLYHVQCMSCRAVASLYYCIPCNLELCHECAFANRVCKCGRIDGTNNMRNIHWESHQPEVVYWKSESSLMERYADIRKRILIAFLKSWADLLALLLVLPLLVSWRNTYVWAQLRYSADSMPGQCSYSRGIVGKPHTIYRAVALGWLTIWLDFCTAFLFLVAILPVIQIPALLLHCKVIGEFWNRYTTRLTLLRAAEFNRQMLRASAKPGDQERFQEITPEMAIPSVMDRREFLSSVDRHFVFKRNSLPPPPPPDNDDLSLEVKHADDFGDSDADDNFEEKKGVPHDNHDVPHLNKAPKPCGYLPSLYEGTDVVFLLGFMPGSEYQEMWQDSLRVFQRLDSYDHNEDQACFFRHQFPRSASLYMYICARHAVMTFSHGLPAFLRFATKLVGVLLHFIPVLYIEISILFANFCYREPQKFSAKDRTNLFSRLGMIHFVQAILSPGYLAIHIALFGAPVLATFFALLYSSLTVSPAMCCGPSAPSCCLWEADRLDRVWNDGMRYNGWLWYGQVLWAILVIPRIIAESFEFSLGFTQGLFHPIKALKWLFYRILTRKVWAWYKKLLNAMVHVCYRHRSCRYLFFGEWFIVVVFVAWTSWVPAIPLFVALRQGGPIGQSIWIPIVCLSPIWLFLCRTARNRIKAEWGEKILPPAIATLLKLTVEFPGHGVVLRFEGKKPPDFTFSQATLDVEGNEFWKGLYKAVKPAIALGIQAAKATALPFEVCPDYLNPAHFAKGHTEFKSSVSIATDGVSKTSQKLTRYLIEKRLNRIVQDGGNPSIVLVIRYAQKKKNDGVNQKGVLFVVTTNAKQVLECAASGRDLLA